MAQVGNEEVADEENTPAMEAGSQETPPIACLNLPRPEWAKKVDKMVICCPEQLVCGFFCNCFGFILVSFWFQITFSMLTPFPVFLTWIFTWLVIEYTVFWRCFGVIPGSEKATDAATKPLFGNVDGADSEAKAKEPWKREGWWHRPLLRLLYLIVIGQVVLAFYSPGLMILPMGMKSALDIEYPYDTPGILCDNSTAAVAINEFVLDFARDPDTGELPFDVEGVSISVGGMVLRFDWFAAAYVPPGQTIYSTPYARCELGCHDFDCWKDDILLHEYVHIWQVQNNHSPYGKYLQLLASTVYNGNPYLYGGGVGLREAREDGRELLDFYFEQQAAIVQEYMAIARGESFSKREGSFISDETPDGRWVEDVEYYALQMLGGRPRTNVTKWQEDRGCFEPSGCNIFPVT